MRRKSWKNIWTGSMMRANKQAKSKWPKSGDGNAAGLKVYKDFPYKATNRHYRLMSEFNGVVIIQRLRL